METLGWFPFSVASFVLLGTTIALYKIPTVKNQSKTATSFWMLFFSAILALIFFRGYLLLSTLNLILVGAVWGFGFAAISSLQMHALKHVEINTLFPATATLSLVLSVIIGVFFFQDTISLTQIIGVLIAAVSIYFFLYKGKHNKYSSSVLILGGAILFFSVFNKFVQKIAANNFDIHVFQIYQYIFAAIFALIFFTLLNHKSGWLRKLSLGPIKSGLTISIPSFFGGWAILLAFSKGPFSLVTSVHAMYIFVAALAGYLFFSEKLNARKLLSLALAVLAISLIKLG